MASRLLWLHDCKVVQLKSIANATGINCSGAKPILTRRLLDELPKFRLSRGGKGKGTATDLNNSSSNEPVLYSHPLDELPKVRRILDEDLTMGGGSELEERGEKEEEEAEKEEGNKRHTIISIDMGIRNLAYCRLILPPLSASNTETPILTHWSRVAISRKPQTSPSTESLEARETSEAFDPQTFATYAHTLVTQTLLPLEPSHILIERQRFRSMGGSSVQEWTLRVNMFEAMLYAVLKTFKEQGLWTGQVHPVAPSKVAKFWIGDVDSLKHADAEVDAEAQEEAEGNQKGKGRGKAKGPTTTTKPPTKSARTKTAKINLVADLLSNNGIYLIPPGQHMANAYLSKKRGRRFSIKHTPTLIPEGELKDFKSGSGFQEQLVKLDDLADCLLQGLGWWKWEKNRKRIMERGKEFLEHD